MPKMTGGGPEWRAQRAEAENVRLKLENEHLKSALELVVESKTLYGHYDGAVCIARRALDKTLKLNRMEGMTS